MSEWSYAAASVCLKCKRMVRNKPFGGPRRDPQVYADLNEYGTGWAGVIAQGGITIGAGEEEQ